MNIITQEHCPVKREKRNYFLFAIKRRRNAAPAARAIARAAGIYDGGENGGFEQAISP